MDEIFKILDDYPAYRISNYGRIQTRWQMGGYYDGFKVIDRWKDLVPFKEKHGYLSVTLSNGVDKPKRHRIHILVIKTFLGEKPKDKQLVRHLDSNPGNNNLSNLCYGTYVENENDKIENGTWNTRNGGAKITREQVNEIRVKGNLGLTHDEISKEYGVSRPTITRTINKKIWKDENFDRM